MSSETIRSWDGTQSWSPEDIHHPKDENQIAALIKQTRDSGRLKQLQLSTRWFIALIKKRSVT